MGHQSPSRYLPPLSFPSTGFSPSDFIPPGDVGRLDLQDVWLRDGQVGSGDASLFTSEFSMRETPPNHALQRTAGSACAGFWYCWDAAYIHRSTLNLTPLVVVVLESLVAGVTWRVVRHIERVRHENAA